MKAALLQFLRCPLCGQGLNFKTAAAESEPFKTEAVESRPGQAREIADGELHCPTCHARYEISGGVPRLRPPTHDQVDCAVEKTAEAFGWQWNEFAELGAPAREQLLDWIKPLGPDFFPGKLVLDAGCGMGRFPEVLATFGASLVVGVDISSAINVAHRRSLKADNFTVAEADISRLPFGAPFDFVCSIGVIHHLPDPRRGFLELVRHVKPGGTVFVWVYGAENNRWLTDFVDPIRTRFTSVLPRGALYALSMAITAVLHPALKIAYAPASRREPRRWESKLLPYFDYFAWLSQFGFRHNHHVVFDHLVAPVAHYIPREEFEEWFRAAGLSDVLITPRNNNSWRGMGVKPVSLQNESKTPQARPSTKPIRG